jgi:hypothetical protein
LLLAAVAVSWGQRWSLAQRMPSAIPTTTQGTLGTPQPADAAPPVDAESHIYFLDVEGWYRITPYETVVRSPYDLTADSTPAMASALPPTIADWKQAGPDQDVSQDPAVIEFLKHPTVALQRSYEDSAGHYVNLALIGNRGDDSFLLFSHTPETCYPGVLWEVKENRRESALLDERPTQKAGSDQRLVTLFWYLWANPERDSRDGVLSVRVNLFLDPGETEEDGLERAWGFVRALFPATIPWERF